MKIRTRLILVFLVLVALGYFFMVRWTLVDLRPRYLATMEESMVDTATLLASQLENELDGETIQVDALRTAMAAARDKRFSAKIYEVTKTRLDMRIYVTDQEGRVIYDSDDGRDEGLNYRVWLDVRRTLEGLYGARASSEKPGDYTTEVLYVAAPIHAGEKIVGTVTVGKPAGNAIRFETRARHRIIAAALLVALAVIALGAIIYYWLTQPIGRLMQYAHDVREGRRTQLPELGNDEIAELGRAFDAMREALEGREYVYQYVQTLTHEMKSPLSAIHGAAELLDEDMPPEQHERFLTNIRNETARIRNLVDRLLQLSAVEKRSRLRDVESINLPALLAELAESLAPVLAPRALRLEIDCPPGLGLPGERFLVRQALANLLLNAIEFSPDVGQIELRVESVPGYVVIRIADSGPGIPDYARDRLFERFYSLPHEGSGHKGTGLGLPFVREVATLHRGSITLENRPEGGACATLTLPAQQN